MRILNAAMVNELNRLESDHVMTMALQLDIAGAPVPYRVVNYDQDISFGGLLFSRASFDVDSMEETTSAALVHIRVTIGNLTRELQSLLENYWASVPDPEWTVTIWQVDALVPDRTPFGSGERFTVLNVPTDLVTAGPDLMVEGLTLGRVVPGRRYTTSSGFLNIPRR
jgi:hypothetical protein